ncbi:phage GP46 family protein [Sansalvadorimonas verongulae]|uniref:phage GP46 family protein n=1 Tax=Sansalvadorimonas verongulae TaxID=2172824 RepID=UPI0012BD1CC0|nr:phage GP46 family protein [Sansalvadorimonas verongulae]MTI13370.1 hypothetical protein [Sansalvadorimonas verongulae]
MSDLRLVMNADGGDLQVLAGDLTTDEGLENPILISLFTDRRAPDDITIPDSVSRRGWWGDALAEQEGDEIGSLLWLIQREKLTQKIAEDARRYCEEALAWLVKDGVAENVVVTTKIEKPDVLLITVTVQRPRMAPLKYQYQAPWGAQSDRN